MRYGPEETPLFRSHVRNLATVPHTSNIPQSDVGHHVGAYAWPAGAASGPLW